MTHRILVVDDEPAQLRLARQVLASAGYAVTGAASGPEAIRVVHEGKADLVLLDVVMPEMDGWQTCRCLREISPVPVVMLTGKRHAEDDVVRGLECGADDYLAKPVGNRELLARVRAALRRAAASDSGNGRKGVVFRDEHLTIDIAEHRVTAAGEKLKLTPREFRLLALLVENRGRVLPHQEVLEQIWGWEYIDDVDYVRIYVSHLRQKLEPEPANPRYILTEPGVGYYFQGAA